jgi:SAM-dependent methyltransferase
MDEKLTAELKFWQGLYNQHGPLSYLNYRRQVAIDIIGQFPKEYLDALLRDIDDIDDDIDDVVNILEIGTGLIPPLYFHIGNESQNMYVALDPLAIEYARIDRAGAEYYVKGSAEDIPYVDEIFNYILCMNCLDHVDDADKALEEMYRVLTPDGFLFLQVHCNTSIGGPHTYSFNKGTLTEIVEKHNFNILYAEAPIKADGIDAIYVVAQK